MLDRFWFASLLIDPDGRWRGRFIRPEPGTEGDPPAFAALLQGLVDDNEEDSSDCLLFVPGEFLPSTPPDHLIPWIGTRDTPPSVAHCVHLGAGETPAGDPAYLAFAASDAATLGAALDAHPASTRIVVDTGNQPGWKFDARPPAPILADIGHLGFLRPAPGADKDRSKPQLLNLLSLVTRDAETREIEQAFRIDPELTYHLLRLVNSVGMGLTQPVKNLNHAITVVGRRQLQRWLQLLIYVNTAAGRDKPNPLLQLAAYRGRLLELLATPGEDPDSAYMVGIFSLLDRVLPQKMSEIVARLPIHPAIREALSTRGGFLGDLLTACESAERGRHVEASESLRQLGVDAEKALRSQHAAFCLAHALGRELASSGGA